MVGDVRRALAQLVGEEESMASKIVNFTLNGRETEVMVKPLTTLQTLLREQLGLNRHQERLQAGRLRQLHRAGQRRADDVLPAARGGRRRPGGDSPWKASRPWRGCIPSSRPS